MKRTNKLLMIILCVTLLLSSLPVFTSAQSSSNPDVQQLLNQINAIADLTAAIDESDPNIINVSGHKSNVATTLSLIIPVDVTVRWGVSLYYSSATFSGSLINFSGDGTFEVVSAAWLEHQGSGITINAAGAKVVVTDDSFVLANTGSAIVGSGLNTIIIVENGGSVGGWETHNINPVINMNNPANTLNNVIVNDGAVWAMSEDRLAYTIQTYGNVVVNDGGDVCTRGDNGRAINLVGPTSIAYINGGKVWTSGASGVAISTATTAGVNVDHAGVIVTGGTVSSTSNYAIHVTGANSFVTVTGGVVSATTGNAIRADTAASSVSISGGFVFAYGTALTGTSNVIHIVGGTSPVITSDGVVVAWNNAKYPGPFSVGDTTGLTVSAGSEVEWSKSAGFLDGVSYKKGDNIGYFPIEGVTVYGLVNVTFDVNADVDTSVSVVPVSKTVTFGSSYGELGAVTRMGYNFIGWFTDPDGGSIVTENTIVKNTNDHTLYAHWSVFNDIMVIFDPNANGDVNVVPSIPYMVVTFDELYDGLDTVTVSRVGYEFEGWYTEASDGVKVTASTLVTNPLSHTLYAQWTAVNIVVAFDANAVGVTPSESSMSVTFDSEYGELATVSRIGYEFVGWFTAREDGMLVTSESLVTNAADHTLYAHWIIVNNIIVTFDPNTGGDLSGVKLSATSILVAYDGQYGLLADVSRPWYIFKGWFTSATDGTQIFADTRVQNANDHTLYAQWEAVTLPHFGVYSVVYDDNGASTGFPPVDYNNPYSRDDVVTVLGQGSLMRDGYCFVGWSSLFDADVAEFVEGSTFAIQSDVLLFAVWSSGPFTVTYLPGEYGTFETQTTANLFIGDPTPKAPEVTGEDGWKFIGWNPMPTQTVTGSIVYTAQWESLEGDGVEYVVHYYLQGTTVKVADSKNVTGQMVGTIITETAITISGYTARTPTTITTPLNTTNNVFVFYYTTSSNNNNNNGGNNNSGGSSTTSKPPTTTQPPTSTPTPPSVTPPSDDDDDVETLSVWAFMNLVLSIIGVILAIALVVCVLLQRKQKQKKHRFFWFITALITGIAGIIVFLLTEDINSTMVIVDKWVIVNAILFIVEVIAITFTFKHNKTSNST